LIQIVLIHRLKRSCQPVLGRGGTEIPERTHYVMNGHRGPPSAVRLFDLVRRDQAPDFAFIDNDKTTLTGPEQLMFHELLNVQ
jgi:hypothetical protein